MSSEFFSWPRNAGRALLSLLAAMCLVVPQPAMAATAEEAFADGNRLFRDELYWAALLRYRQAAEAGMDTPVLHFNTGVAHYRAGQYDRARESLLKASRSPRFAAIAQYNIGLTEYAGGDTGEALRWFRMARDQESNAEIQALARKAIARLQSEQAEEEPPIVLASDGSRARKFTELELYASAGFGSDDNVYRSPGQAYVDRSNPNGPVVVDPVVQSGTFVPVRVGARYSVNSFEHEKFFGSYRMAGRFYPDKALQNADEYIHQLAFGSEHARSEEGRESRIFSAFTVAQHKETYYDPDTGLERSNGGVSVEDRLSYVRVGPEIWTRQSWDRFSFRLHGKAQLWNYENIEEVPEYDHEFFDVGGYAQYRFTPTSLLRLTTEVYRRNFSDRPSFELDGTQPIGNPSVEYDYVDVGISARQRVWQDFWFGVNYVRTQREDGYVGYNDYTRDGFGVEFSLRAGERFRLQGDTTYRVYDYSNAYAFNNPAAGRKTQETLSGGVSASFMLDWNLTLVGEYVYREVASNDTRLDYERSRFMLSLQWNYD